MRRPFRREWLCAGFQEKSVEAVADVVDQDVSAQRGVIFTEDHPSGVPRDIRLRLVFGNLRDPGDPVGENGGGAILADTGPYIPCSFLFCPGIRYLFTVNPCWEPVHQDTPAVGGIQDVHVAYRLQRHGKGCGTDTLSIVSVIPDLADSSGSHLRRVIVGDVVFVHVSAHVRRVPFPGIFVDGIWQRSADGCQPQRRWHRVLW